MTSQTNRNALLSTVLVDGNLEYDYLSGTPYVFQNIPTGDREYSVRVSENILFRLDYLASVVYGDSELWWIIATRNDILNPAVDMYIGQLLIIPNIYKYYEFYGESIKPEINNLQVFDRRNFSG